MKLRNVCAMGLLVALASTARANLLINGSLEIGGRLNSRGRILPQGGIGTAWSITQGTVDLLPTSYWKAADGRFSVDLIGTPGPSGASRRLSPGSRSVRIMS